MKYYFVFILITLFFTGCSKEKATLEAFNPESFAFNLGNSWEVNGLVNVKGFMQKEMDGIFSASINYSVDLISPDGHTNNNIFEDFVEAEQGEEIIDIPLEAQFELDSTYAVGKYKLVFNIHDNFSGNSTEATVELELSE